MRYGIALGEIGLMVFANLFLHLGLPLAQLLVIPILAIVSNFLLNRALRPNKGHPARPTAGLLGWIFYLDAVCLTILLMASGGPSNPFTVLYLVHITLAAAILSALQTWLLGLFSIACFALLFELHRPVPELGAHHTGNLHFVGMWLSFVVAVLLVAIYASRISGLLRQHEAASLQMQMELAKKDRVASLVTLAAGAAHELSTPLSTIAVVAKELERAAASPSGLSAAASVAIGEDSRLIREQVERCREILQRMSDEGAEPAGEASVRRTAAELLEELASAFPAADSVRIVGDHNLTLFIPRHALLQALQGLVKNAIEASAEKPGAIVEVRSERGPGGGVQFLVRDHGCGMPPDFVRRAGEPFLTSKPPGKGMGLGVFLARNLAEKLGGSVSFTSEVGHGTTATLQLPAECIVKNSTTTPAVVQA